MSSKHSLALLITFSLGAISIARAQNPEDETGIADDAVRHHLEPALAFYNAQRFSEALTEFEAARRIEPSPSTDLYIARCNDRLNHYASAIRAYSRYLSATPEAADAPKIRQRIQALKARAVADDQAEAQAAPRAPARRSSPPEGTLGEEDSEQRRFPRKLFGLGSSISPGHYAITASNRSLGGTTLILGDLWLDLPITNHFEIQLWLPILQMALVTGATVFWSDVFFKFYLGGDGAGFFLAPGIGFWYVGVKDGNGDTASGNIIEVPFRIGYEFASDSRGFGFSLGARPWVDFIFAGSQTATGWGAVLEMVFTGYFTHSAR